MDGIAVHGLTRRYGRVTAVDDLSFTLEPGRVTGFVGRNGAGKTTTLRMVLGLTRPSAGAATIDGLPYSELRDPLRRVGALIEADSFHPGRTGRNALRAIARLGRIPDSRVDVVSSHLLAELAQTVDDVIVIERGRLVAHDRIAALAGSAAESLEDVFLRLTATAREHS